MERSNDRVEIADLHARFGLAVNTRDRGLFATLWVADAFWRIDDPIHFEASGRDAIVASWANILATYDLFAHCAHTGTVTFTGDDAANGFVTVNEWGRPSDGKSGYFNAGLYEDELRREAGVWKYARRIYRYLYLETSPLAGTSYYAGNASATAHDHAIATLRSAAAGAPASR